MPGRDGAIKGLLLSAVTLAVLAGVLRRRPAASESSGGIVRVALLSDTHVAGPEYPLHTETGPLDNAAITKTQQRLWRAVRAVNAMQPSAGLVLFVGDVVHNGVSRLRELGLDAGGLRRLLKEPTNGFKIAAAILSQLQAPRLYVWGNHDNMVACGNPSQSPSKALTAQLYKAFFGARPYDSRDLGSWKIIALNAMHGATWDPNSQHCNPVLSSYGEDQLRWLDKQLAEGKPSLILTHFPLATSVLGEVDRPGAPPDLRAVLLRHSNVKLLLTGHFHKGISWEGLYPFPALTLPAVRYNPQNFFLLHLHPDGRVEWHDSLQAKNRGGARCSDWWSYEGQPRFAGQVESADAGDCGVPAAGKETEFELQPVLNTSLIPSLERFNPERSCQLALARPFLEACAQGPTADCCKVVAEVFRPSSSAPFATCLCQPSFWQGAVDYLQQMHGVDLAAAMNSCVSEQRKLVAYRGGGLTWCPAVSP
ncbi:hypothetical protein ABPG77_007645 [Micractinium sp. CCAP 211/92]